MIRRLFSLGRPSETRFFLFVGAFGLVLSAAYWVLGGEVAGLILLGGFGLGAGLVGVALLAARRNAPAGQRGDPGPVPFGDERGRLPDETLAPLALGLGAAMAATAVVFGPWLLVAGLPALAWGGWAWLAGAGRELAATRRSEGDDSPPAAGSPDPGADRDPGDL